MTHCEKIINFDDNRDRRMEVGILPQAAPTSDDIFPAATANAEIDEGANAGDDQGLKKRVASFNLASVLLGEDRKPRRWLDKGTLSNMMTFLLLLIGMIIRLAAPDAKVGDYILGLGLFGFSGGITNWLAVKVGDVLHSSLV